MSLARVTRSSPVGTRVTRIAVDERRPGVARVFVDDEPYLTVPAELVTRLGLAVGSVLTDSDQEVLGREADVVAAYRTALRCLERRSFASRDLYRRLVQKGHPTEAAEQAIARATEAGLLDDEAHARHFIETRFARGRGPARLRLELAQAGIPRALTDRLLAEVVSEEDVDRRMLSLAQKRASQLQHLPRPDRVRRVTAFLARRGYRGLAVRDTVREVVGS